MTRHVTATSEDVLMYEAKLVERRLLNEPLMC